MVWNKWAVLVLLGSLASLVTSLVLIPEIRAAAIPILLAMLGLVVQSFQAPVARPFVEARTPEAPPPPPTTPDVH